MKKILLTLVVFTVISPSIALASWWNPISWFDNWGFIFNKKSEKTEVLEKRIEELENRLQESIPSDEILIKENDTDPDIVKVNSNLNNFVEKQDKKVVLSKEEIEAEDFSKKLSELREIDLSFSGPKIDSSYVEEAIYNEGQGDYGSFLLTLYISTDQDIYIPLTTTDSTLGSTGFSYSLEGDEFRGHKSSKVNCTLKQDGYCKIKAGSYQKEISVSVWVYPEEPGDYNINFKKLGYKDYSNNQTNYIDINKVSENIYIGY